MLAIRSTLIFLLFLASTLTGYAAPPPGDAPGFEVVTLPAAALTMPVDFAQALSAAEQPQDGF